MRNNSSSYLPQAARVSALWICFCLHLSSFRLFYNHPRNETCTSLSNCFLLCPLSVPLVNHNGCLLQKPHLLVSLPQHRHNLGCMFLQASIFILQTDTQTHIRLHFLSSPQALMLKCIWVTGLQGFRAVVPLLQLWCTCTENKKKDYTKSNDF